MSKKKSNKKEYFGLKKKYQPRSKRKFIDYDYIDKLTEKEKEWLSKFTDEYYSSNVHLNDKKALHKSDKLRKDCYNRDNQIRRDVYAKEDFKQLVKKYFYSDELEALLGREGIEPSPEDKIIEKIDNEKALKRFDWPKPKLVK